MPYKARHPCNHPGCANLREANEGYCSFHKPSHRDDYARKDPDYFRLYNNKRWRAYRRMYLQEHPLCINFKECHNAASVVDHIKPHNGEWDMFWESGNHQSMCESCHNRKTAKEKGWGRDG